MSPGGLFVIRPSLQVYRANSSFSYFLLSDLHIGASGCDEDHIRYDINQAVIRKDRILILGDVMDMITTRDEKRYNPASMATWLSGRSDIVNAQIERASKLLAPAAKAGLIDMISCGNHETAVEKHNNVDPISILVDTLQAIDKNKNHKIYYGGYAGFVNYEFCKDFTNPNRDNHHLKIFYWHGSGGGHSVSSSISEFEKKSFIEDVNVLWFAHKHVRLAYETDQIKLGSNGRLSSKSRWNIRTGGYLNTYSEQSQESFKTEGRRSNYGADKLLKPYTLGGVRLVVNFPLDKFDNLNPRISIEYSSPLEQ